MELKSRPWLLLKSLAIIGTWLRQHGQKLIALIFWLALLGGYWVYVQGNQLSPREAIQQLLSLSTQSLYAPLIYILIYTLRPLIFGSTVILTSAAGYLFGPILGTIYAIIGGNLSASLAYIVGRFFGQGALDSPRAATLIQRYAYRIQSHSFETILFLRFLLLPYDLVSYFAGFLHIRWAAFALATFLGGAPGTVAFVLFGASIDNDFVNGSPSLDPGSLTISIALFVASFGFSWYLKRREKKRAPLK